MARVNKQKEAALSPQALRSCLSYDPETGIFIRKSTMNFNPRAQEGAEAGYVQNNGYRVIRIGHTKYLAHRLAWFWVYGEWPSKTIDHINRDRLDNRISNLRDVSHLVNCQNGGGWSNATIPIVGVSVSNGYYCANLYRNGQHVLRKKFRSLDDAIQARKQAVSVFNSGGVINSGSPQEENTL